MAPINIAVKLKWILLVERSVYSFRPTIFWSAGKYCYLFLKEDIVSTLLTCAHIWLWKSFSPLGQHRPHTILDVYKVASKILHRLFPNIAVVVCLLSARPFALLTQACENNFEGLKSLWKFEVFTGAPTELLEKVIIFCHKIFANLFLSSWKRSGGVESTRKKCFRIKFRNRLKKNNLIMKLFGIILRNYDQYIRFWNHFTSHVRPNVIWNMVI